MYVWQVIVYYVLSGIVFDLWHTYEFQRCMCKGKGKVHCKNWQCKMCTQCEYSFMYGYEPRKKSSQNVNRKKHS